MDVAVRIRHCSFSYGKGKRKEKVIDEVDLTVPNGVIYALLGPSGCGKTTLLKMMTAQLKGEDNNNVLVLGSRPGSKGSYVPGPGIGYMPQELALYENLTMEETLRLFGRLNLVSEEVITERILELIRVLELRVSFKKKLIGNLSGGQQRRVSLATALLHDPPLLILDEPTVGVDPLLRKQIWEYLVKLTASKRTTIIITTHYIEEAKDANLIGAMRKGRIIVEGSPSLIMSSFHDQNLESCFYKMCYVDTSKSQSNEENNVDVENNVMSILKRMYDDFIKLEYSGSRPFTRNLREIQTPPHSLYRIKQLVKRNFVLRRRFLPLVLFQIFIPLISMICYCASVGRPLSSVTVALVNDEMPRNFSSNFINLLDSDTMSLKYYDFQDGLESVKSADTRLMLHFKPNFTDCVLRKIQLGLEADNETIVCSSVSAYFDNTNIQIFYSLYGSMITTIRNFYSDLYKSLGSTPLIARLPLDLEEVLVGDSSRGGGEYTIPGIVLMTTHFLSAGSIILVIEGERKNGMFDKLRTTAVTWPDILISQMLTEIFYMIIQSILLLFYIFYVYGSAPLGSPLLLLVLTVVQGCSGMSLGFLLSSLVPRESNATIALTYLIGIQFAHCFTNGILWPLEGMSLTSRNVVRYLPLSTPIEAFQAIMFRGWGLKNLTVILGFVSSFAWFIVYFSLSLILLR